jgi:hypothetical protein
VTNFGDNDACWIVDFSECGTTLYATTNDELYDPLGCRHRLFQSWTGIDWHPVLDSADGTAGHIWSLEQFQGYLYMSDSLDGDAYDRLYRMDGAGDVTSFWSSPDLPLNMLAHGREHLYLATYPSSTSTPYVYAYDGTSDPQLISDVMNQRIACLYIPHEFCDIRGEHWAFEEIEACYQAGVVAGYPNGHYDARRTVTRDQMAVYISRALAGGDSAVPDGPPSASFSDVPPDHWAYRYVEYAADQGVVEGYQDGDYRPGIEVDRGQMAVYIARARGWVGIDDPMDTAPEVFPDVPASFWAGTAVQACTDNEVVQGYGDGRYHPERPVSRGQMAVYVARAFGLTS